jgi:PBP1b-binding outer membrane lipoprotein LpoB
MKNLRLIVALSFLIILTGCNSNESKPDQNIKNQTETQKENPEKTGTSTKYLKPFNDTLPTIGLLIYNGVLQSEVIATSDFFVKPSKDGE